MKNKNLIFLFLICQLFLTSLLASPFFDQTSANVWKVDEVTGQMSGYRYRPNRSIWVNTFQAGVFSLGANEQALINNLPASSQPMSSQLAPISLTGFGMAELIVDNGDTGMSPLKISPASGNYTKTIMVEMAVDVNLTNNGPLLVTWNILGDTTSIDGSAVVDRNTDLSGGRVHARFYLVKNGNYTITVNVAIAGEPTLFTKAASYNINNTDPNGIRRDTDADGLPDLVEQAIGLNPLTQDWRTDTNENGWSDFDEWLRSDDWPPVDGYLPNDSDNDGWSDFDENLRSTNPNDPVQALVGENAPTVDTLAYDQLLKLFKDTPAAARLYAVEYVVDVTTTEVKPDTVWEYFSSYIPGNEVVFDSDDLLIREEMKMSDAGLAAIPARRTTSLLGSLKIDNTFKELRLPATRSQILDIAGVNTRTVTNNNTGIDVEEKRTWHLLHWLKAKADLTPSNFDAGTGWTTADEWKNLFITYLGDNLVVTQSLQMNLKTTTDASLLLGVLSKEYELASGPDSPVFTKKHAVSQAVFESLEVSLAKRENNRTLDDVYADLLVLAVSNEDMSDQFSILQSGISGMQWKQDSLVYLSQMLSADDNDAKLLAYLSRFTLFADGVTSLTSTPTLGDTTQDSDADDLINGDEILTRIFSQSTYPWKLDSDNDLVSDSADPCPLDAQDLCQEQPIGLSVSGSGSYDVALGLNVSSYLVVTVQLDAVSDQEISVDYEIKALAGDSAIDGVNFQAISGTLTIPAGETNASAVINLLAQSTSGTNVFHLVLSNPINTTLLQTDYPITVNVSQIDFTSPVITLLGEDPVSVTVDGVYIDAGATAEDDTDGDITNSIIVAGDFVDTSVIGTYQLTYDVVDVAGNDAVQVTRTINVLSGLAEVNAYYSAAPNWNDYVKSDSSTPFNASNTPADGTETGGYLSVIHGGEMRAIDIGVTTCTDQAATDALGVFDWICDDSSGSALMVSTGLMDDKNLSDLLDFTALSWKENSVTVVGTGAGFTTAPAVWWGNPVTENNIGGSLATTGSVYVVTSNPAATYTVDASKIALIIKPGVTVFGPGTSKDIIVTNTQSYLWFEGTIDVTGDNYGFLLSTLSFSVLRNLFVTNAKFDGILLNYNSVNNLLTNIISSNHTFSNGGTGIEINGGSNNTLSNITTANNQNIGVQLVNSSSNILSNINVFNNKQHGLYFGPAWNNVATNIRAVRNPNGIYVFGAHNVLSNLTVSDNNIGVVVPSLVDTIGSNNTLLNVTASNNNTYGLEISGENTILSNVTVTNTRYAGLEMGGINNNVSNLATINNAFAGIRIITAGGNHHFSNIAALNTVNGIGFSVTSNNIFTGLLKVGGNTGVDCGDDSLTTFSDANCTAVLPSDFTLISDVTAADSFVAKVITNDTANTSDTNGTVASFPVDITTFDWLNFDNIFRAWGSNGSAFPSADNRNDNLNKWASGAGRIWDWSLANGDTGDAGSPAIQNVLAVPISGDVAYTIEHAWVGTAADQAACTALVSGSKWFATDDCRSTYLRNATEFVNDNIGNNNGLCESNETCLFTPNIGSYQGHGKMISAGDFVDGDTLSAITLKQYSENGY